MSAMRWVTIPTWPPARRFVDAAPSAAPGTGGSGQPINETLALWSDKQTTLGFLAKRVPAGEFTRRAKFNVFDGVEDKGRLALEVWEDSFVRTFKVANVETPKGQRCSG